MKRLNATDPFLSLIIGKSNKMKGVGQLNYSNFINGWGAFSLLPVDNSML